MPCKLSPWCTVAAWWARDVAVEGGRSAISLVAKSTALGELLGRRGVVWRPRGPAPAPPPPRRRKACIAKLSACSGVLPLLPPRTRGRRASAWGEGGGGTVCAPPETWNLPLVSSPMIKDRE